MKVRFYHQNSLAGKPFLLSLLYSEQRGIVKLFWVDKGEKNEYNCRMVTFDDCKVTISSGKWGQLSISVPRAGEVHVKVDSCRYSEEEINAFLQRHKVYLRRRLAEAKAIEEAFPQVFSYRKALIEGEEYDVCIDSRKGNDVRGKTVFACSRLEVSYAIEKAQKEKFLKRVSYFAQKMGVDYGRVSFGKAKSKRASCSIEGNLFFRRITFMLPPDLCDYLIVHELAHRKEMNHSPAFWKIVEILIPDRKAREKALNLYDFLQQLYI